MKSKYDDDTDYDKLHGPAYLSLVSHIGANLMREAALELTIKTELKKEPFLAGRFKI